MHRVARGIGLALRVGSVEALVVGERVGIGTDHMGMDKRGTVARSAVLGRPLEGRIGDSGVGTVKLFEMEIGETGDKARNVATGGLHFHGHGNRVFVVLHAKNHRQPPVGSRVQRLPEFAFAGGAVPERDISDFIALELDILELAVIAIGFLRGLRMLGEITPGFGASHGLQNLGARGGRLGDDVEPLVGPVRRHLTAAGTGIVGRSHGAEQHFIRSCAQGETQRAVAVVRIEPVGAGLQRKGGSDAHGFVASA